MKHFAAEVVLVYLDRLPSLTAREHKQTAETTIIIVRGRAMCPSYMSRGREKRCHFSLARKILVHEMMGNKDIHNIKKEDVQ